MSEQPETKKCKFCGKSLPQEAIFCYYCQRELLTRPERPSQESPTRSSNKIILIVVALIVISSVLFLIFN